ncbi:hypothetical protein [Streptomyces clavifer]|uniref:Uncharacterized protein n=1 Tax=Streptomyces clavifer TaxID=68188 RepID=A0ABS4VI05_9ACTN|nr:hypothetical protein [Streptomyces clavifer]GHB28805.1 hypothetical protein GCM10010392_66220 [Streptomyces clavifer]
MASKERETQQRQRAAFNPTCKHPVASEIRHHKILGTFAPAPGTLQEPGLRELSRDPFCCFTTSLDLQTFFDCNQRAIAHFNLVPMTIVYDRTKTVVRRHVAPGEMVPLHPEAVKFAGH